MQSEFESLRSRLAIWGLLVVSLSFAYMPALQGYFLNMDDYNLWTIKDAGACRGFYAWDFAIELGRPLCNYLICALAYSLDSIKDANSVRFVGILMLASVAYIISRLLRSESSNAVNSLLAALAITTLPSFQVNIGSIVLQIQLVTILMAIAAYYLAFKGSLQFIKDKKALNKYSFIAIATFLASLLTYTPSSMFYWVMLAGYLTTIPIKLFNIAKRRLLYMFCIGFVSMGIYFIYAKVNYIIRNNFAKIEGYGYAVELTNDYVFKLKFFLFKVLEDTSNLWNISPSKEFASGIILLIFTSFSASIYMIIVNWRKQFLNKNEHSPYMEDLKHYAQKCSLFILLAILSYAPALASKNMSFSGYRVYSAILPFTAIILYWALCNISLLLPAARRNIALTTALVPICLFGIYSAHYNIMNYYHVPQNTEIKYLRSAFNQSDLSKYERIHVILLDPTTGPIVVDRSDTTLGYALLSGEFGGTQTWNPHNMFMLLKATLPDIKDEKKRNALYKLIKENKISAGQKKDYKEFVEPTLVIDLTRLYKFY